MNKEKFRKYLESEPGLIEDARDSLLSTYKNSQPVAIVNYTGTDESFDWSIGGNLSKCFGKNEEVSCKDSQAKHFVNYRGEFSVNKVLGVTKFYASEISIRSEYWIESLGLYGSKLTQRDYLSAENLTLFGRSTADINFTDKGIDSIGRFNQMGIYNSGNKVKISSEVNLVESSKRFQVKLKKDSYNNDIDLDFSNIAVGKVILMFEDGCHRNNIKIKLHEETDCDILLFNVSRKVLVGNKLYIEGGRVINDGVVKDFGMWYERK